MDLYSLVRRLVAADVAIWAVEGGGPKRCFVGKERWIRTGGT